MVLAGLGEAGAPRSQPSSGWSAVTSQDRRPGQWHCSWGRLAGSRAGCHAVHCTLSPTCLLCCAEPGLLRQLWGPPLSFPQSHLSSPQCQLSCRDSWGLTKSFLFAEDAPFPPLPLIHRLTVSSHIWPPAVTSDIADMCPCILLLHGSAHARVRHPP